MDRSPPPAIQFRNLGKKYGDKEIFTQLSGSFPAAKISLIIGKNGSGKSTLMRILCGSEAPDDGEIQIGERELFKWRHEILADTFFVSENFNFTLRHKVGQMKEVFGPFYPQWQNDVYDKWIANFKLSPQLHFQGLSRGQKMQVVFALALASGAQNLFIDEITAVLDAHARFLVLAELDALSLAGRNIIMATNLVLELRSLSNVETWVLKNHQLKKLSADDLKDFAKIRVDKRRYAQLSIWHAPLSELLSGEALLIVHQADLSKLPADLYQRDRRENTLEEYFLYHSALQGEMNEKVA